MQSLAVGTDNVISLSSLFDNLATAFVNTATVSGELLAPDGTSLYTFSLDYVDQSDGDYQGVIPATVTLTPGTTYYVLATATTDGGNQVTFRGTAVAEYIDS
jgi:hypothetical protein